MRTSSGIAPPIPQEGLMRAKDAARFLAMSERHLYSLTKQGMVPSVRLGKRAVRYAKHDLDAFISYHRHGGEVQP